MKTEKNLHQFALLTAIATFFLIIAGGLVTSTQSGLSVPDWPLSYGQLMPPMVGGILYEHGHRMVATFVGFLTTILAILLWKREERKWVRNLGLIALGAIIAQGVLGGLTVLFLLPTPISVSHATLAQSFFAIIASIALFTSEWWKSNQPLLKHDSRTPHIATLAVFTTGAIFIQLILGALMRHTNSGLAVPDFPLAYGQIFPSVSPDAMARYNDQLIRNDYRIFADDPLTASQVLVHMIHRVWAVVVTVMVLWTAFRLSKLSGISKRLSRFSYAFVALVCIQISLGAFTVLSRKSVDITTAHVVTGALLLVTSVLTTLNAFKLYGIQIPRLAVHVKTTGVIA
ncbi:MAG: heme A synthase [Bacteroidota bacterium]